MWANKSQFGLITKFQESEFQKELGKRETEEKLKNYATLAVVFLAKQKKQDTFVTENKSVHF